MWLFSLVIKELHLKSLAGQSTLHDGSHSIKKSPDTVLFLECETGTL